MAPDYQAYLRAHTFDLENLRNQTADYIDLLEQQLLEYRRAFACCDEHKPNGGSRSECLECALIKLTHTISRIDYAVGQPNEMELSLYDTECDEDVVLLRVQRKVAELEQALRESNELLLLMKRWGWFLQSGGIKLPDRIAANERILGEKHE